MRTFFCPVSDYFILSPSVLLDIKNLGFETSEGFKDVMKKGTYKCYWNRVYLVGNFNIGKTTLAKVLVGDVVPEVRESTDGIWLYIGLAGMTIKDRKWIFLPKGMYSTTNNYVVSLNIDT